MLKDLFKKYTSLLKEKGIEVKFSEEEKMVKADLKDGGTISTTAESWVPGVPVLDESGAPVADGEYILADGTKVEVAGGLLVELYPPQAEEMSAEKTAEALEIIAAEQEAQIEVLTEEKANLETSVEEKEAKMSKMSAEIADLKKKVETLSKLPAATSVKHKREDKNEDKPLTRGQQIMKNLERKQAIFGTHGEGAE